MRDQEGCYLKSRIRFLFYLQDYQVHLVKNDELESEELDIIVMTYVVIFLCYCSKEMKERFQEVVGMHIFSVQKTELKVVENYLYP